MAVKTGTRDGQYEYARATASPNTGTSDGQYSYASASGGATSIPRYGFADAFFNTDPSLKNLIGQATAGNWSADKFSAALQTTPWYRNHTASQREWTQLQTQDPRSAKMVTDRMGADINEIAGAMGADIPPNLNRQIQSSVLANSYSGGNYDKGLLQRAIAAQIHMDKYGHYKGAAGQLEDSIRTMSADYGIPIDKGALQSWVQGGLQQAGGDTSKLSAYQENVKHYLAEQAKLTFPGLAKSLDAGMPVAQAASPYVTSYAKILEQPIDSSSQASQYLQDPTIKKALQYQDPNQQMKGTGTPGIMPMYQFEQTLRQDPRWMKTNNARDQLGSAAYHVVSDFGLNPCSGGSSCGS